MFSYWNNNNNNHNNNNNNNNYNNLFNIEYKQMAIEKQKL